MRITIRSVARCALLVPAVGLALGWGTGCDNSGGAGSDGSRVPRPARPGAAENRGAPGEAQLAQLRLLVGTWETARYTPAAGADHPITAARLTLDYQSLALNEDGTASAESWLAPPAGEPGPLSLEELAPVCQPGAARRLVRDTLGIRVLSVGTWTATLRDRALTITLEWAPGGSGGNAMSLDAMLQPAAGNSSRHLLRLSGNPVIAGGGYTELARYE